MCSKEERYSDDIADSEFTTICWTLHRVHLRKPLEKLALRFRTTPPSSKWGALIVPQEEHMFKALIQL